MTTKKDDFFIPIAVTYFIILFIGFIYFIFFKDTFSFPSCPIYTYLHIPCPACGMTRATFALVDCNFILSMQYNPFIIYFVFATPIYLISELLHRYFHINFFIPFRLFAYIGLFILFGFWIYSIFI